MLNSLCPLLSGLYAGIKFFLIDFIFKRCPRLRAKYDTPYIIWRSLPTDPQLKERSSAAVSRRVSPAPSCGGSRIGGHEAGHPQADSAVFTSGSFRGCLFNFMESLKCEGFSFPLSLRFLRPLQPLPSPRQHLGTGHDD